MFSSVLVVISSVLVVFSSVLEVFSSVLVVLHIEIHFTQCFCTLAFFFFFFISKALVTDKIPNRCKAIDGTKKKRAKGKNIERTGKII